MILMSAFGRGCPAKSLSTVVGYFTLLALNPLGQIQILKKYCLNQSAASKKVLTSMLSSQPLCNLHPLHHHPA